MKTETWKPVVGYEGWYKVSDRGRVCRIKAYNTTRVGRILRPIKDKDGYYLVDLYKEGVRKHCKVHRLVLMAFAGFPEPGQEGNHKNGIKSDNYPDNLEWVTKSENGLHSRQVLGQCVGEKHGRAKLINKDIPAIRRLLAEGNLALRAIGGMFDVSKDAIWQIKLGKTWTHV